MRSFLKVGTAVGYVVFHQPLTHVTEVYVKTLHLLFKLEEADRQLDHHSGKAIVFGSYASA